MRPGFLVVALCLGAFTNIAIAEVTAAGEGGFSLEHEVHVSASREDAWEAAVGNIGQWWSDDHTISGRAAAMSIDAKPLGCFCEAVGHDGGVVHLVVTSVNRNVMLRMTGALGPLGLMGVDGNMTWEFFDADGGTRIRFAYAVGGYYPDGLDSLAAPVNGVIGEALQRLKAFIETGDANPRSAN